MFSIFLKIAVCSLLLFGSFNLYIEPDRSISIYSRIENIIIQETVFTYESVKDMSTAVETASYKYSLHPTLILAIIKNESKFDSKIDNGTGTGLMQVVGSVHGVSKYVLTNPEKNILIGSKILYKCKTKFKSEMKTLQCYNGNFNITYYGNKVLNTKRKYDLLYYSIN